MKQNAERLTSGLAKFGWGGKVITRISVRPLTVRDNPNGVQLIPKLRQTVRAVVRHVETARNPTEEAFENFENQPKHHLF